MGQGDQSRPAWMDQVVANVDYGERDAKYHAQLLESQATGKCIFCAAGFPHDQKLYWEDQGWFLFECRPPRKDVEGGPVDNHLILAPRAHGEVMTDADWLAFAAGIRFVEQELGWTGFGIGWRVGDPDRSGRTIVHIHAHLILPRQKYSEKVGRMRAVTTLFPIG